jgi:hypothetical protein
MHRHADRGSDGDADEWPGVLRGAAGFREHLHAERRSVVAVGEPLASRASRLRVSTVPRRVPAAVRLSLGAARSMLLAARPRHAMDVIMAASATTVSPAAARGARCIGQRMPPSAIRVNWVRVGSNWGQSRDSDPNCGRSWNSTLMTKD